MSIGYEPQHIPLSEIIERAARNATVLIPDLQRPYVWTPRQVILLMDSLFKGWPFGSLLLWEVKPTIQGQAQEGIPHRTFWQLVDRTQDSDGDAGDKREQPATYQMVLDGQQRIQSLLLALGGDGWGFKLYDHEWSLDLHGRKMRRNDRWSKASLCVHVPDFIREFDLKKRVRKAEAGNFLAWAILDQDAGRSSKHFPPTYQPPLQTSWENAGNFIRLSRLWDLAERGREADEYEDILGRFLEDELVPPSTADKLKPLLAKWLKHVEDIKFKSYVDALQIKPFSESKEWTKDDYYDAIVNIFTRLNTAGRTLTREEITMAWLKVGWPKAGEHLSALQESLSQQDIDISSDEAVRLVSFIWAVETRDGRLLESKDLLKGNIIRPMAAYVSEHWQRIADSTIKTAEILNARSLGLMGSVNALIVIWTLAQMARDWADRHSECLVTERDAFDKLSKRTLRLFSDRWVIGSQWANVWAENAVINFRKFSDILANHRHSVIQAPTAKAASEALAGTASDLLQVITGEATRHIDGLSAGNDRSMVRQYWSALWIWHRLDAQRWQFSSIPMRIGRQSKVSLEVDHTVSHGYWSTIISDAWKSAVGNAGLDPDSKEAHELGFSGFSNKSDAEGIINSLGNCSLLEKSFNISKSDGQLGDFLSRVLEFQPDGDAPIKRSDWEGALAFPSIMLEPTTAAISDLRDAIMHRDELIRRELKYFLNGNLPRRDIAEDVVP